MYEYGVDEIRNEQTYEISVAVAFFSLKTDWKHTSTLILIKYKKKIKYIKHNKIVFSKV